MQVLITTGHPNSDYQLVHGTLETGGTKAAHTSRREGLTPHALTESILLAHDMDSNVNQLLGQISPGRVWEDLSQSIYFLET